MFDRLVLFFLCCCRLVGVFGDSDAVKSVSVTEGDPVTLNPALTDKQSDNLIMWNFKTNGPLIAKINQATNDISIIDDGPDKRFRDRLKLNHLTGSLTIMNITTEHAGVYQVTISSKTKIIYRFNVTVYARLPVPVIISDSLQNSSSHCSLVCSVVNVGHVTLSWYKGNSLLSSIGVSDLNNSLSLHLECLDDSYSCVLNNPISNQTKYVNITDLCRPCSDCAFCCNASEAVARLAVSVVVGVATVAVVVYDIITSRKGVNERRVTC
ncbi:SLAM family member 9-like [Onychostoma macrolepis]|uniref:SLAM family member 9-like n=1 Tax=Onychostoma macrolepis TaxID=369639 RepID=UPI00272AE54F|nr:SLAM family member 9-like [Onychostoma macrolepis]